MSYYKCVTPLINKMHREQKYSPLIQFPTKSNFPTKFLSEKAKKIVGSRVELMEIKKYKIKLKCPENWFHVKNLISCNVMESLRWLWPFHFEGNRTNFTKLGNSVLVFLQDVGHESSYGKLNKWEWWYRNPHPFGSRTPRETRILRDYRPETQNFTFCLIIMGTVHGIVPNIPTLPTE